LGTPGGNIPPTANANGPYTGDPGVALNFSSAGSSDSDGSIASYQWNFGDGNTSTQANPSHTYATAGAYTVTLTVTDNEGATGTDNTTATIGDFCPGVEACDGNIQLTLITDRYASETSWTLRDGSGTVIESGSGYSNSTTYNINWNLTEDQYTFTINDSYGDGICCGYGNGSYTITDGCSNTIVTGGKFW
jgi:PKD repeat protein